MISVVVLAVLIVLMRDFSPVIWTATADGRVFEANGQLVGDPEEENKPRAGRSAEVETLAAR